MKLAAILRAGQFTYRAVHVLLEHAERVGQRLDAPASLPSLPPRAPSPPPAPAAPPRTRARRRAAPAPAAEYAHPDALLDAEGTVQHVFKTTPRRP